MCRISTLYLLKQAGARGDHQSQDVHRHHHRNRHHLMTLQHVPDRGVPKRFPYTIRPVDIESLGQSVPDRGFPILDRKQAVDGIITKANSQKLGFPGCPVCQPRKPIFIHLTRRKESIPQSLPTTFYWKRLGRFVSYFRHFVFAVHGAYRVRKTFGDTSVRDIL